MSPTYALRELGLAKGADATSIRKAYAALLKAMDVDADPEGYARLRLARDVALRAARLVPVAQETPAEAPAEPAEPALADEQPEPATAPWLYAAPLLDGHSAPPAGTGVVADLSRAAPDPAATPAAALDAALDAPAIPLTAKAAFAGPPLVHQRAADPATDPAPDPAPDPANVSVLPRPDRELARLLHAADDTRTPLNDAQEAQAQRALAALLADAAQGDLTLHGQIEDWLADLLAETWPRSAPLLQSAADAFGWENERGQLNERRSIAWLNARLRGFRFQEKVTAPDHPLHKAWTELHRPGWSTWLDRRRVKRAEVKQLLDGVRTHFPELEDHFDPQRVGSWEATGTRYSFGKTSWWFGGFLLLQLVRVLAGLGDDGSRTPVNQALDPLQVVTAPADPDYDRIRDAAIVAAFGPGKTIFWLREKQASLAATFEANLRAQRRQANNEQDTIQRAVDQIRRMAYIVGRRAEPSVQTQTMALHLDQIDAASRKGPQACIDYLHTGELFGIAVPDALRAREQALASAMVEAGTLATPQPGPPERVSVPGAIIGRIIDETGLPDQSVRNGMDDKGSAAERCAVKRALLHATLNWKGPERAAILRIL